MTHCPSCGTQVSGKFCPSCGTQVTQAPPVAAAAMPLPEQTGHAPRPPQMPPGFPPQRPRAGQPVMPPQPPVYPGQAPMPNPFPGAVPAPKKGGGVLKVILIILGVILGLFILLVVVGSLLPDETGGTTTGPSTSTAASRSMGTPVITDGVDKVTQKPLRTLSTLQPSTEDIFVAVEVNVKAGSVLSAKWYYEGRHQDHLDTDLDVDKDYKGWASFNIGNGGKLWPAGSYKVELFIDDRLHHTANFSVK